MRRTAILFGLLAAAAAPAPAAALPPGSFDTAFGTGGVVRPAVDAPDRYSRSWGARPFVVLPDGAGVAGGSATDAAGRQVLALQRLSPSGAPDPAWASGGEVRLALGEGPSPGARAGALLALPDGGVVAAGTASLAGGGDGLAVARTDAAGGVRWAVVHALPGTASWTGANDVAVTSDGALLVSGAVGSAGAGQETGVARLSLEDGRLDPAFGTGGQLVDEQRLEGGSHGVARDQLLAPLPDGRFLLSVGFDERGGPRPFELRRYAADGTREAAIRLVRGFAEPSELVPQADGTVLAAGQARGQGAVARFRPDLTMDPAFGFGSVGTVGGSTYDEATGLAVEPDGRIAVAVSGEGPPRVARLTPDGRPDLSFPTRDLTAAGMRRTALVAAAGSRIVVAGLPPDGLDPRQEDVRAGVIARVLGGDGAGGAVRVEGPARRRGRVVALRLRCAPSEGLGCAGTLRLGIARGRLLGRTAYALPGGRRLVRVRLGRRARAALRRRHPSRLRAAVTNTPQPARVTTVRLR